MADHYALRNIVFESGERFAIVVDRRTGLPLFDTTVFTLTEFRARNRASATIEQVLRALKVFLLFCDQREIDITQRVQQGRLLDLGEIDALARSCRLAMSDLGTIDASLTKTRSFPRRIEPYRVRAKESIREVATDSTAIRMGYISQFIAWLTDRRLLALSASHPTRAALIRAREIVIPALTARTPPGGKRSKATKRRSLDDAAQRRLWEVIDINSPENPWKGRHARARNELIVRWFMGLGIRRGELLGVRISDVNFRTNEVFIARRADDGEDPRTIQPNAKTSDRVLPMSDDLARRARQYIMEERREYSTARKHEFLFVANGGAPLSLRGLNKIFNAVLTRHPDLPKLYPHLFRHTYNYNFSRVADELGLNAEKEKKTRSQLMGWSETSNSASQYTRREIEEKARRASLHLQSKLTDPRDAKE